jgi:hypothetical protein
MRSASTRPASTASSRACGLGVAYRGTPHGPFDSRIGHHAGGRLVYWGEPDGHVWEALTVSYARQPDGAVADTHTDGRGG